MLDIEFPEYDSDGDGAENKNIISSFIERDPDKNGFNPMKAGQYLFMHLLPTTDISQLRLYSAHIEQTKALKEWADYESGLSIDWGKIIFDKSSESEETAQAIKGWLTGIAQSPERILRHAMIEGCDEVLQLKFREICTRQTHQPIDEDMLKSHVNTIKDVVKILGPSFESDSEKSPFYLSTIILLITSECQEEESRKTKDQEFKNLMGVLDRIRNLHAHSKDDLSKSYTVRFIAFTFLVYLRSRYHSDDSLKPFEKNLLDLFTTSTLGYGSLEKSLKKAIIERKDKIGVRITDDQTYQYLLEGYRKVPYDLIECYRLFLFNHLAPRKRFYETGNLVLHHNEVMYKKGSMKKGYSYQRNVSRNNIEFGEYWSDDYIRAFYSEAFSES